MALQTMIVTFLTLLLDLQFLIFAYTPPRICISKTRPIFSYSIVVQTIYTFTLIN